MSGKNWTPGPWDLFDLYSGEALLVGDIKAVDDQLAEHVEIGELRKGVDADAVLIAAAPDLCHALEQLIQATEHLELCPSTLDQAREALAKARGEEQD